MPVELLSTRFLRATQGPPCLPEARLTRAIYSRVAGARLNVTNGLIAASRQKLRQFVAGFLDVLRGEPTGPARFTLAQVSYNALCSGVSRRTRPDRHEVHAHVTLRQGMQPAQDSLSPAAGAAR